MLKRKINGEYTDTNIQLSCHYIEIFDFTMLWLANRNEVFQRYKSEKCSPYTLISVFHSSCLLSFKRFSHTHETPRFACKPAAPLTLVLHITPSGPQLKTIKHCWNFLLSIPACVKANKSPRSAFHPSFCLRLKALSTGFLIWFVFGRRHWLVLWKSPLFIGKNVGLFVWRGLTERTWVFGVWLRAQRWITTDPCKECRGLN